ncbi:hypothetical protein PC116_g27184 [Phytophthora cactorum]|nr:hypothetical protein Pcac1_g4767 [Phytophthora cactorum]KAG2793282.1 hypothetical protein PC111_g23103 [Phytophthora cactorum]KAG2878241.1 hypothetical protein PC115_g23125 [Phytophthora cactorum]KAG2980894.1 hypothetical protein PC118_g10906 [Phytophthora cactorum]KAG4224361.1 hypothetical protein PC116_g27184 [Phytophthora cactorum]
MHWRSRWRPRTRRARLCSTSSRTLHRTRLLQLTLALLCLSCWKLSLRRFKVPLSLTWLTRPKWVTCSSSQGAAEATSSPDSNASSAAEPRIPLPASTETQVRPSQEHARTGYIKRGEDGVQSYVNRLLKRVAEPAGSTVDLTSHSFRRGGAQHANGDDRLAAQWIFDRGAWDMTKTSKAFAYITNTAREDRKVARVLSGWSVDDAPKIIDIKSLDHASQERLGRLRLLLFSSCTGLKEQRLNVSTKVLNVLTAYLVRYYPQMKELAPAAP